MPDDSVAGSRRARRFMPHLRRHYREGADTRGGHLTNVTMMIVVALLPGPRRSERKGRIKPEQDPRNARSNQDRSVHVVMVGNECANHQHGREQ